MPTGGFAGSVGALSSWFASSQWACSMAWSLSTSSARCSSSCWRPLCRSRTRACSRASLGERRQRGWAASEGAGTKTRRGAGAAVDADRPTEGAGLRPAQFGFHARERVATGAGPELVVLQHLPLPLLPLRRLPLELGQLRGQFLLMLCTQVPQLLPGRARGRTEG